MPPGVAQSIDSSRHSSSVSAMGFSTKTCFPGSEGSKSLRSVVLVATEHQNYVHLRIFESLFVLGSAVVGKSAERSA